MKLTSLLFAGMACITLTMMTAWPAVAQMPQGRGVGPAGRGAPGSGHGTRIADNVVIQFDPETGSLIVITDEDTNAHIQAVVEALDRPVPQVLIRVLFLEVTHSDGRDLGVEFMASDTETRYSVSSYERGNDGRVSVELGTETRRRDLLETIFGLGADTTGGFYRLTREDFQLTVRALSEVASLEVLSRPSILTRNNQEAVITVGQQVPFIRNTRILQDGQQLNTVEYEDIGIILRVTPQIRPGDMVAMQVTPEISTLTGETVPISDTVRAPVFAKRSAETGVVVPNGETVVIGGLMEDQETQFVRKVPLFGDIPVLGNLFKRTTTNKAKTELLIFLTPHIVHDPMHLAGVTRNEQRNAPLASRAYSEGRLGPYVVDWPQNDDDEDLEALEPVAEDTGSVVGNRGVVYGNGR